MESLPDPQDGILALTLHEMSGSTDIKSFFTLPGIYGKETLINPIDVYKLLPSEFFETIRKEFYGDSSSLLREVYWSKNFRPNTSCVPQQWEFKIVSAVSLSLCKSILLYSRENRWKPESFDTTVKILNELFGSYLPKKGKYNLYDQGGIPYDEAAREKKKREEKEAKLRKEQEEKDRQITTLQQELEDLRKEVQREKDIEAKKKETEEIAIVEIFSNQEKPHEQPVLTELEKQVLQSLRDRGLLPLE